MSKKNKTEKGTNGNVEPEVDEDTDETPQIGVEPDDDDQGEYEFDASLFLDGVKLVDLAPDFVRPNGFLMVPRLNAKTGEIAPKNTTFVGILNDIVPWVDNRGKERVWYSCTATAQTGARYTGKDEGNRQFDKVVLRGDRIGISGSGAINALKTKKGHFLYLHWTGNKVQVKNGNMWEVKAKVSAEPVPGPF
jgi:hypothetical protein